MFKLVDLLIKCKDVPNAMCKTPTLHTYIYILFTARVCKVFRAFLNGDSRHKIWNVVPKESGYFPMELWFKKKKCASPIEVNTLLFNSV